MIKWMLVLAVVVLGYVWWRHQRQAEGAERAARQRPAAPPAPAPPAPMLRCRHCGVHLPANEAVRGTLGPYCSDEHRRLAEG